GHQYFRCNPGYGVLVRPDRLTRREASKRHTENRRSGESRHCHSERRESQILDQLIDN
ncbi:hypothetical protein M9458_033775, partial [Cirrhinus mrigala]